MTHITLLSLARLFNQIENFRDVRWAGVLACKPKVAGPDDKIIIFDEYKTEKPTCAHCVVIWDNLAEELLKMNELESYKEFKKYAKIENYGEKW